MLRKEFENAETFVWLPEEGYGFYPCKPEDAPYDHSYFEKYLSYEETEIGHRINAARLELVRLHLQDDEDLIDVGIGSGTFVRSRPGTRGFDVNIAGVNWLNGNGLFSDPYQGCENISCWDSLEHIRDPDQLLSKVRSKIFVAIPIFKDCDHVLHSKHYRKDEHFYYFTRQGLILWMGKRGFVMKDFDRSESLIGREDIESFVFERK